MSATLRRALTVVLAAILGAVIGRAPLVAQPRAERGEESPADLRESLRTSTVAAIELEIDAYTEKLNAVADGTGDEANRAKLRQKIADLEAERERFVRMPTGEYPDPVSSASDAASVLDEATAYGPIVPAREREATLAAAGPYDVGDLLEVAGTSRSGPFYHFVGIVGGNAAILEPGKSYRITLYLVYRREYFGLIGDYHAYIGSVR